MKLIEKLAEEWMLKNRELNSKGEGSFSSSEAYEAGFRKAREMAAKLSDDWQPDDTDGALGIAIRSIGEQDVG